MSDNTLIKILNSIPDSQSARVNLQTNDGTISLDANYRVGVAPAFFLNFPGKDLPKEIDSSQHCTISINSSDERITPLILKAEVKDIVDDSTLELTAKNTLDPAQLRRYFRVAICTPVTISYLRESNGKIVRQWSLAGETLDLSGSGFLGLFDGECQDRHGIQITLELPAPEALVSCQGHVVHARRVRRGRWQIAMHFDDITNKQRDAVISNCLNEQRNQLIKGLQPNA